MDVTYPHAFTPLDAMWLHVEDPTSTTLIAGLLLFDEPVDWLRLRGQMAERLLRFERFSQQPRPPVLPFTLPVWEPDLDFDLDAHLHCTELPDPAGWPELKALIEGLLARPLPRDRPLWQMHLIERYGPGSALVVVFEHTIADGFASMYLLESITDLAPDAPPPPRTSRPKAPSLAGRLAAVLDAADTALHLPGSLLRGAARLAGDPARAARLALTGLQSAEALTRYVLMLPDPHTPLRGRPAHSKRIAATQPLPLAEIRAVAKAFGATVNDVLATAIAGAFRRYLAGCGVQVDGLTIRASMPYNLRPPDQSSMLGNGFALVFLDLPISLADPVARLRAIKGRADFIKHYPEAPTSLLVLKAMGFLPALATRLAMHFFAIKCSTVITNVPGLPEPRYLAGRRIERVMFWAPSSGGLAVSVSILSYAGDVTLSFFTDARAVPDPEELVAGFAEEYAVLRQRAGGQPVPAQPEGAGPASRRCQAITRTGQPCRNPALPGSTCCRVHAGRTAQIPTMP